MLSLVSVVQLPDLVTANVRNNMRRVASTFQKCLLRIGLLEDFVNPAPPWTFE